MFRVSLVSVVALSLINSPGGSLLVRARVATSFPVALSLADARKIAARRNIDILTAQSDLEVATGQRQTAGQWPNPTLGLSSAKYKFGYGRSNGTALGNNFPNRSYDNIASVGQLVELGGKRTIRRQSGDAAIAAARARADEIRREVDLSVRKTYIASLLADANRGILDDSARSLRHEAALANVRFQAGDISTSDRDQIEIAAAQLELSAKSAANTAAAARVQLEVLLGETNPTGRTRLTDSLERLAGVAPTAALAPEARPDVIAAGASLAKAASDVRLEHANQIPDPTFQLQYEREPPDNLQSLGFAVSVPLPLPGYNQGAIRAARAAQTAAAAKLTQTLTASRGDLVTARLAYEEAKRRARAYQTRIRPQAERVRETVSYAYARGGASLLELLAAQRAANDVRAAELQAAADCATAAAALLASPTTDGKSVAPRKAGTP